MPNFKPYDYNQTTMVVINYQDQLQPGTFEYALHQLLSNKLDLSIFEDRGSGLTFDVRRVVERNEPDVKCQA